MGLVAYFVANSTLFVTCVLFVFITCSLLLFVFFNRKTFYNKKIFRTYKYQNSNIMKIERPDIIPDRFYTPLEAALLLEVNEQTLLKWSRYPSSGITRYHKKENHLLRFKGCDLLILWEGEEQ